MSDDDITIIDDEVAGETFTEAPPSVKTIDEWATLKNLGPKSWEMACIRAFFHSVIGKETTEAEFDDALHHARNAAHGA